MKAQRLLLKLYAEPGTVGDPERFVPVFHGWIRDRILDEVLIDVARYGHVHHGPAVMLVGQTSDYTLDLGEGRPGLVVTRKRNAASEAARLADIFDLAFAAAARLESEPALTGLRFRTDELRLTIADRLNAPNDEATFSEIESELRGFFRDRLGPETTLQREGDESEAMSVRIRRPSNQPVVEVAQKAKNPTG